MSHALALQKSQSRWPTSKNNARQDLPSSTRTFRAVARKRLREEEPEPDLEQSGQGHGADMAVDSVEGVDDLVESVGSVGSIEDDEIPELLETVADSNSNNAISVTNYLLDSIENAPADDPIHEALTNDAGSSLPLPEVLPSLPILPEPPQQDFDEDSDELAHEPDTLPDLNMLPPSRRPSIVDLSEEVPHKRATWEMKTFAMALGLWCETSGVTRQSYQSLLEVFDLLEDLQTLKDLPRSVTTLKKYVNAQLPLMKLRRQEIDVVQEQLPTQGIRKEVRVLKNMMYFFDPIDLFTTVLSATEFRAKIHTRMAIFVDEPSELYHSLAWASSIRACSGDYVFYPSQQQSPIFPSDVVYYHCKAPDCFCQGRRKFHMARITAIGRDRTTNAEKPGEVKLLANPLYVAGAFGLNATDFPMPAHSTAKELFLSEQEILHLGQEQIHTREADIHFDYRYEGSNVRLGRNAAAYKSRFVVRQIFEINNKSTRPLQLSAPIRGALELSTYGRTHLANFANANSPCLSIPLLTFIDAFGLYRNMYRSLTGIYATIAGLSWRERKRRANVLPLALGPHGSDFADVIKILEPGLAALDRGLQLEINGIDTFVCVFTMAFTGDMKQQQDNSGFMSPIANRGCAKCLVTKKQKADLTFNIILNARYHHRVLYERTKGDSSSDGAKFFQSMGMKAQQTPLVSIAPALDIIRSRPGDAAHSEYAGIAKQAQYVLFAAVLTEAGANAYCAELRHFPFPPGWGRLQSPKYHLTSFRMQECGRISIITPLLLRTWLESKWINPVYLRAAEATMSAALGLNGVDTIVACYAAMAKSNTVVLTQNMSTADRENMISLLLRSRKAFQRLYQCAALACSKNFKRSDLISSRHTTPANNSDDSESGSVFEDSDLQHLGRSEYEHLAETFEVEGAAAKQASAFRNVMARPNVHTALHYEDVATEYATPNNCTTLSGEDKHRFFKKAVTQTNFRDVEKVLLTKESLYQTLRFILAGSYIISEPRLTTEMMRIHSKCPTLLADLLPYSELGNTDEDSRQSQSQLRLIGDVAHERPLALGCLDRGYVKRETSWPLWPSELPSRDEFLVSLQRAYEIDYRERNAVPPRGVGLQWCQKLSFTDRISEHRIVLTTGDFISVRDGLARIDGVFVHELSRGRARLFVRVRMVEDFRQLQLDPVLQVPYQKLSKTMTIVGLPGIGTRKHYVLHVARKVREDGVKSGLERGGQALLLNCNYDIQFM